MRTIKRALSHGVGHFPSISTRLKNQVTNKTRITASTVVGLNEPFLSVFENKLSSHKNKKQSTTNPSTKTTINNKLTILYKMNYFNLKHFLLSAVLIAGNNVEAVEESQLRGSDERKLQDNRLAGQYVLDMVNTRNTQPYYPQWDYSGDDFTAYTASSSRGNGGPYLHRTNIFRTNPNSNCQTCSFEFQMDLDEKAVGGYVWIDAIIQWNRNTGKAEVTNVYTNTNNIGDRTRAIMSALDTTEYIKVVNSIPYFYGDTRKQNRGGKDILIPYVDDGQAFSQSQLFFSTEGQWTNDDFTAYGGN